jgi:hypothetical protein
MAKFTHPPYDEWLTTDQPLSPYQNQALQEHLTACETCRQLQTSWNGVRRLMSATPQLAPAAGFTSRWRERQALARLARQRQQIWLTLGFTASAAAGLLIFFGLQLARIFDSPTLLLLKAYTISTAVTLVEAFERLFSTSLRLTNSLPLAGIVLGLGFTSLLSVLWFVAYRQLTSETRRNK